MLQNHLDEIGKLSRCVQIPIAEPSLCGNERRYVDECLEAGWVSSQGPFVGRFEQEFARCVGVSSAVSASSGTTALHLALETLGIGPGDEVIVPDLTFAATINSVLHCGATPVLVDVDRQTWNIDISAVRSAITKRTRAIMPVHLYGQPAAMDDLVDLSKRNGLWIVEDAAEALGSRVDDRMAGTIGDVGVYSFFANKLITCGEGGMAVFRDPAMEARARILRDHGMTPGRRYWHEAVGFNYRLTSLQAAIGLAQVEQFDDFLHQKTENAKAYRLGLSGIGGLTLPAELARCFNSYWLFSMIVDPDRVEIHRDELARRLKLANIETRPLFHPLHTMPPYRAYAGHRSFPNAIWLSDNGISLPSSVRLGREKIEFICEAIRVILSKKGTKST